MYKPYASSTYYLEAYEGSEIKDECLEKCLKQASRHIDSLTFNRIVKRGFENLSEFQKEVVQEVCCAQAEFEYENQDVFDSILKGYSVNGVSMEFGESWNVTIHGGIPMRKDLYEMLAQTGLCTRILRG